MTKPFLVATLISTICLLTLSLLDLDLSDFKWWTLTIPVIYLSIILIATYRLLLLRQYRT